MVAKKAIVYCFAGNGMAIEVDGTGRVMKEQIEIAKDGWGKGDTITILLDCQKWRILFWKNETFLKEMEMEWNMTCYPGMGCCSCLKESPRGLLPASDFKLIAAN